MTKAKAMQWAATRAKRRACDVFVIWSEEETDLPGQHYQTATDDDLETFYNGTSDANIIACFGPDGAIQP